MIGPAPPTFDLYGVDSVTLIIAFAAMVVTTIIRYFRGVRPATTRRKIINDFLNGSVIYPFALLMYSVPNAQTFEYLKASRISVGLAGFVGIIFVLGELLVSSGPEKNGAPPAPPTIPTQIPPAVP